MDNQDAHHTENTTREAMLTAIEARVLGSLMEKQLTTPDAYPITLNALVLACNQKTSREPVSNYESGEIQRCASQLQDKKWIEVDYSARAARYDQRLTRVLGMDKATQAILNVMLLRGPQTLSEILTRTQRMFDFGSIAAVEEKLEHLCAKTTPYFVRIPRLPGQREDRFMHLLCGEPDIEVLAALQQSHTSHNAKSEESMVLQERVNRLEEQVALLQQQVQGLLAASVGIADTAD